MLEIVCYIPTHNLKLRIEFQTLSECLICSVSKIGEQIMDSSINTITVEKELMLLIFREYIFPILFGGDVNEILNLGIADERIKGHDLRSGAGVSRLNVS
jgi:hypothetical protein